MTDDGEGEEDPCEHHQPAEAAAPAGGAEGGTAGGAGVVLVRQGSRGSRLSTCVAACCLASPLPAGARCRHQLEGAMGTAATATLSLCPTILP